MEIQTRRHILEIWRSTIEYCYRKGQWRWGGRSGRNSISDAEQLLTILYPATIIESLNIDSVDETADDVLEHLRGLGNAMDIPRQLIKFIAEYMRAYLVDGTPDFSGDTYFDPEDAKVPVEDVVGRLVHAVDAKRLDDGGGIQDGQQLLGVHDRISLAPAAPSPFSIAVGVLNGCAPDLQDVPPCLYLHGCRP